MSRRQVFWILLVLCLFTVTLFAAENKQGYQLSKDKYEKAIAFARARYTLYFVNTAYGVILLLVLLRVRVASRFRDIAERVSRFRFVQAYVFVPLFLLTLAVLSLPIDLYSHHLSVKYEQSIQGWDSWFWDWTKLQLISFVLLGFVAWILYLIIRSSPKRWWFYFWLVTLPIIVFFIFAEPFVIEPLFFKFEPLQTKNAELVGAIEKVVQRGGLAIPPDRMFEMKASEKFKSINAYVTGIGPSKRVVVWDTTIQKATVPETLYIFGHEMGHYVLRHIPKSIVFTAALLFVFLLAGSYIMRSVVQSRGAAWGIKAVGDWASLPALLLLFSVFSFLFAPVFNTYSRYLEHEADLYGLEVIHGIVPDSSHVASHAFQVLGEVNLSDPNPSGFIKFWLYDHPSVNDRILFVQSYDPWSKGESPKFVK